jgi:alkylation response protein AidB-like acyl-CoA dehydrogenase
MDQAISSAQLRVQFDTPIIQFPRVGDKIAMMAADMLVARELTCCAARSTAWSRVGTDKPAPALTWIMGREANACATAGKRGMCNGKAEDRRW